MWLAAGQRATEKWGPTGTASQYVGWALGRTLKEDVGKDFRKLLNKGTMRRAVTYNG